MKKTLMASAIAIFATAMLTGCGDDPLVKEYNGLKKECEAVINSSDFNINKLANSESCNKLEKAMMYAVNEGKLSEETAKKDAKAFEKLIESKL